MNPLKQAQAEILSESGFLADAELLSELMRETLASGNAFRFQAMGESMWPFIRSGDTLTIVPFSKAHPRLGDVVAFVQPSDGRLLVHRVIQRGKRGVRIKGDHRCKWDEDWIGGQDLIGYVTRIERGEGEIRLGLGPEKRLIAVVSRLGVLVPVMNLLRAVRKHFA